MENEASRSTWLPLSSIIHMLMGDTTDQLSMGATRLELKRNVRP